MIKLLCCGVVSFCLINVAGNLVTWQQHDHHFTKFQSVGIGVHTKILVVAGLFVSSLREMRPRSVKPLKGSTICGAKGESTRALFLLDFRNFARFQTFCSISARQRAVKSSNQGFFFRVASRISTTPGFQDFTKDSSISQWHRWKYQLEDVNTS
jgi:hypothetical protein